MELEPEVVRSLMELVRRDPEAEITIDLRARTVAAPGTLAAFEIDDFTRWRLLEGLDDIGLTLRHADAIAAYEARRPSWMPTAPSA